MGGKFITIERVDRDQFTIKFIIDGNLVERRTVYGFPIGKKIRFCTEPEFKVEDVDDMPIYELIDLLEKKHGEDDSCVCSLSVRALNSLVHAGVKTVVQLFIKNRSEVEKFRNLGVRTLKEIEDWGRTAGLSFGMKRDEIVSVIRKLAI